MTARRLRVAVVGTEPARADADLQHPSCWRTLNGVSIEVTAAGGSFTSGCQGGVGPFVVTRIVAPMEDVDQAIFLRRGLSWANQGKTFDTSAIAVQESLDNLEWTSEALKRGIDIPLDDFDLVVSRGRRCVPDDDPLPWSRATSGWPPLPASSTAGKEAIARVRARSAAHLRASALYHRAAWLGSREQSAIHHDDQICRLNNLGTGQACQTALCQRSQQWHLRESTKARPRPAG